MSYVRRFDDKVITSLSIYSLFKRDLSVAVVSYMAKERPDQLGLVLTIDRLVSQASRTLMSELEDLERYTIDLSEVIALETDDPNPQIGDPIAIEDRRRITAFAQEIFRRLARSVLFQLDSDAKQARLAHDNMHLRIQMMRGLDQDRRLIESERQKHSQSFSTTRRDALGRSRDSEQFVMTELRYGAYRALNLSVLYKLALMGEDQAKIDRPDHKYDGLIFNILEYDELEDELFHPNAMAIATPID